MNRYQHTVIIDNRNHPVGIFQHIDAVEVLESLDGGVNNGNTAFQKVLKGLQQGLVVEPLINK
jgi:hypothetical protein